MSSQAPSPRWWQVYLSLPVLVILFLLEERLILLPWEHQALQLGILLLVFVWVHIWLRMNAHALNRMDREELDKQIDVIVIVPRRPSPDGGGKEYEPTPLFHLPLDGLKGVLSDTTDLGSAGENYPLPDDVSLSRKE